VAAVVDFYGPLPQPPEQLAGIHAPVLVFHGADDSVVDVSESRAVEAALRQSGKAVELHVYPGAGHAFFNDSRSHGYNAEAAYDAWQRTRPFLAEHLRVAQRS
jgi:carboxymethylenebutenolidase